MYARLGNASAVESRRLDDGTVEHADVEGKQVTTFEFPEGLTLGDALLAVRDAWGYHAKKNDDGVPAKPAWVESDSEGLTALLAEEFGCPTIVPNDWE